MFSRQKKGDPVPEKWIRDRYLFRLSLSYPHQDDDVAIVENQKQGVIERLRPKCLPAELREFRLQAELRSDRSDLFGAYCILEQITPPHHTNFGVRPILHSQAKQTPYCGLICYADCC